jgi:hypothetical protein
MASCGSLKERQFYVDKATGDMSFREEVQQTTTNKIERILQELSEEDSKDLLDVLRDPSVQGTSIGNALRRRGYSISDRVIQRYRKDKLSVNP